jgi:hypothetical protein
VIRLSPNYDGPQTYHNQGLAYYYKGDYTHARVDWKQALCTMEWRRSLGFFEWGKGVAV